MALIDMKLSKKESKEEDGPMLTSNKEKESGPKYPYGLSINLEDEAIGKLKLDIKNFKAEEGVSLKAKGTITKIKSVEGEDWEAGESLTIQITHLEIVSSDKFEEAFKEASEKKED